MPLGAESTRMILVSHDIDAWARPGLFHNGAAIPISPLWINVPTYGVLEANVYVEMHLGR